jgi:Winged helix DNA-binding domain
MRRVGERERRARLGARHRLASHAATVEEAVGAVVGLHSSDPATVYLSSWVRVDGFEPADLEDALYRRRALVRMLGMRRTLFVVPVGFAPLMHEACTKALIPAQRARLVRMLEQQGVARLGRANTWLEQAAAETLAAIAARGEASARDLTADVPRLGAKLTFGEGTSWAGTVGVSTRVLFLLATEGLIVRTRPLGAWTSGQYRWATTEHWLGAPLREIDHAEACSELLGRWLRSFGPATMTDIRWWTGWTAALAKTTLGAIDAAEVRLAEGTGYLLPDDLERAHDADPWVALLPGLDPTAMGWKERGWYLGDHASDLFDRNGNAGPTVWANGRVVGAWAQAEDGEVVIEPFARLDAATRARLDAEGGRLAAWLGDVRIRPRFATPLGKELATRSGGRASRRR